MGVPLDTLSAEPITLPCVFTGVNYVHIPPLCLIFGKKRGVGILGFPDPPSHLSCEAILFIVALC